MTEKPRSIQEMMDGIKRKYYNKKLDGYTDGYFAIEHWGMQEVQKEIEKWIGDDKLLDEQKDVLIQLHGNYKKK